MYIQKIVTSIMCDLHYTPKVMEDNLHGNFMQSRDLGAKHQLWSPWCQHRHALTQVLGQLNRFYELQPSNS
jgi:hypothetical protein